MTESLEPDEAMPEQIELEPAEALDAEALEPIERRAETLDEPAETADTAPLDQSSDDEPPPPPKRVRKARVQPEPKAKVEPKAEPKRRGRPPGARNIVRAPAPVVQQDPMEIIMTSMRERRQAHQERQHTFFQSFLPA